jgi:hypothetical protein
MKIPKYIKQKIQARGEAQAKANSLQKEIEEWFEKRGLDIGTYQGSHVCLYTEPRMVALTHFRILEYVESEDTE